MGTIVHEGSGLGVVVQTGTHTAFGQIAAGLAEHQGQTAFEVGLARFSRFLFGVAGVLTVSIFIINVALHRPLIDALLFSLAIAVGIAPEMMPAIVTVSLVVGLEGTGGKEGAGQAVGGDRGPRQYRNSLHRQDGHPHRGDDHLSAGARSGRSSKAIRPLLLGLVCNEAAVTDKGPVGGNALDQALWSAPGAATGRGHRHRGLPLRATRRPPLRPRTAAGLGPGRRTLTAGLLVVTKGAPEVVLDRCVDVPDGARSALEALFSEGARVVAVASRPAEGTDALTAADEQGLALAGFLTFADRPKADAGESIAQLEAAGGGRSRSSPGTTARSPPRCARRSALECTGVLSGQEVEALDDDRLEAAILTTTVFARISPDQKSRIIKVARRTGKDVAFLGRRGQRCRGVAPRRRRHLGGLRNGRGQGRRRRGAARQGSRRPGGRRHGGSPHLRQHDEVRPHGHLVELRQHVQCGRRICVPDVPPDAAVADPAQQSALQHGTDGDPDRSRRSRGVGSSCGVGHEVHPAVHGRVRPRQLHLRLRHLLGHAVRCSMPATSSSGRDGSSSRSPRRPWSSM